MRIVQKVKTSISKLLQCFGISAKSKHMIVCFIKTQIHNGLEIKTTVPLAKQDETVH